jgi:uncharacterized protein
MKEGVRVLAVACAPTEKKRTLLVGVISRKGYVEGVVSTSVAVDGTDSTERIARLINGSRFREQIRILLLNGLGVAGLNILDVEKFEKISSAKVLSITRKRPHPTLLIKALRAFSKQEKKDVNERLELVKRISKLKCHKADGFYLQTTLDKESALRFAGNAFEQVRLAHLIARGIASGESVGRI